MLRSALLLCALLATSCAETPPASAPHGAPHRMPWEQFCEQATSIQHANLLLAARGAEGWELVSMYNGFFCYKRPAAAAAAPVAAPPEVRPQPAPPAPTSPVPILRDPGF